MIAVVTFISVRINCVDFLLKIVLDPVSTQVLPHNYLATRSMSTNTKQIAYNTPISRNKFQLFKKCHLCPIVNTISVVINTFESCYNDLNLLFSGNSIKII